MDKIYEFTIDNFGVGVLRDFKNSVFESISRLSDFPEIGQVARESEMADTKNIRQLIVKNHRIIYMIENKNIYILTILNSRQDLIPDGGLKKIN